MEPMDGTWLEDLTGAREAGETGGTEGGGKKTRPPGWSTPGAGATEFDSLGLGGGRRALAAGGSEP
ncbi:MAG: hypothetical protein QM784_06155 [Polyangiaceae bacterium]